jgi:hypothetical protein
MVVGRALLPPPVAAGDHLGRAVGPAEAVDRPDRRDAHRWAGTRDRVEAVVDVDVLRRLPGQQVDGQVRRQQVAGQQQPVEQGDDPGVFDQRGDRRGHGQQCVDALGPEALEVVAPPPDVSREPGLELGTDTVEEVGLGRTLDDDVSRILVTLEVASEISFRGCRRGNVHTVLPVTTSGVPTLRPSIASQKGVWPGSCAAIGGWPAGQARPVDAVARLLLRWADLPMWSAATVAVRRSC